MSPKSLAVLALALAVAGGAAAQNIAIVNGKAVPKARVDILLQQASRGGQQQITPELEAQARDEVVLREIFAQEAEKRGIAADADYRNQMELARQTHPDPRAVRRLSEEEPDHRRRSQGRVRQVQGPVRPAPSTARATSWSRRKTRPTR